MARKTKEEIKEEKRLYRKIMLSTFMDIWKERKHVSEISGKWLGDEALTIFFHHIYSQEKYPEMAFLKENIILLTRDEHVKVENDPVYFQIINDRRELLREQATEIKRRRNNDRSFKEEILE